MEIPYTKFTADVIQTALTAQSGPEVSVLCVPNHAFTQYDLGTVYLCRWEGEGWTPLISQRPLVVDIPVVFDIPSGIVWALKYVLFLSAEDGILYIFN